jgi:hypothetical protein
MSPAPDNHHAVKRVVLPSGKTIEIVYFADAAGSTASPSTREDLHVCPDCRGEMVYPLDWEESGDAAWTLALRCPECEWHGDGTYPQRVVEDLDEKLDDATQVLVRDLRQLTRANMEDEAERFISALRDGHIWPLDF